MPKKRVSRAKSSGKDDRILFAFLATFLSIIGFIIALVAKRDDKYVMFYAKQSLVVFIAAVVLGIVSWIFAWIPVIGRIIDVAVNIVVLVLWVVSWIYAISGKEKQVPVIGQYADSIKL